MRSNDNTERLPLRHDAHAQEQLERARSRRRHILVRRAAKILVLVVAALVGWFIVTKWTRGSAAPAYVVELQRVVRDYDAQNVSAAVAVSVNGVTTFTAAVGLASEELRVPLTPSSLFPVASNTKLFMAVALYQLQERGLVNLSSAVNDVLGPRDFAAFGLPNQTHWCPRLAHASLDSPCERITFVQLLHMGSGIGDAINCDNVAPEDCHQSANDLAVYHGSIGAHVGSFINAPLAFTPGTNYSYSNPNFVLAGYLVEAISGESLASYVQTHIVDKIGLTDTIYDPYSGLLAVQRNYVGQYVEYYVARNDSSATANGLLTPTQYLATGTCSPYINSGAVGGSGGIRSTVADMHKWYVDLFHDRGRSSKVLTAASIHAIVHLRNPSHLSYAQGVGVAYDNEAVDPPSDWPSTIEYTGGTKCALTCMRMAITSPTASTVVSAFTNHAQFYFASATAFAAWQPTEFLFESHAGVIGQGLGVFALRDALANVVAPASSS